MVKLSEKDNAIYHCDDDFHICLNLLVENIALNKPATQSTTAYGGVPWRAVDGNTKTVYGAGSCSHTGYNDPKPWWMLDLQYQAQLSRVELTNRAGGEGESSQIIIPQILAL